MYERVEQEQPTDPHAYTGLRHVKKGRPVLLAAWI